MAGTADTNTSEPAIAVAGLGKTYGAVTAVECVDFAIAPGCMAALLGGNGAGKTTTLAMLLGLVVPSRGTAHILGADMAHDRARVLHRINFQSPYADMPMRLTVRQNLTVYGKLYGLTDLAGRIQALAAELKLEELLDRRSGRLSAGQKTRVGLAKALLNAPEVLLLDEPTASLDPDTADWVRTALERYRAERGATILIASHNMAEVERLADRAIMLNQGRVEADGTPAELIRRYGRDTLEDVFLDIARGRRSGRTEADRISDAEPAS